MAAETHYIKKDSIIKNITSRISYQYILCSFVYGFCHLIFANLTFEDKEAWSVRAHHLMLKQLAFLHTLCVKPTQRHVHTLLIDTSSLRTVDAFLPPSPIRLPMVTVTRNVSGRGWLSGGTFPSALASPSVGSSGHACAPTLGASELLLCHSFNSLFFFPFSPGITQYGST